MDLRFFDATVIGIRALAPLVRELVLRMDEAAVFPPPAAGAHIQLYLTPPSGVPVIRHYSLIGGDGGRDDAADCFRIAIRREAPGNGSAFLHEGIALGSRIAVSAPRNEFPLMPMSQHSLLVAGGIGITPLYSMVRKLVRTSRSFELHFCGRDRAQLAYVDDLRTLAGDRFHLHVTDGDPTRRLDLAALVARQPAGTHSYVCGPVRLVEAMHAAAAQAGWGPGRVHSEVFTEALAPDEACFDVVLRKSGMTISSARATASCRRSRPPASRRSRTAAAANAASVRCRFSKPTA